MHAGTLWIDTNNDQLIKKIIKKYKPNEYRKDEKINKYRLWWD